MTPKRGDVVLALFPDSNLRTAKPRPGLVVQADSLATGLPQVIVAMITSNKTFVLVQGTFTPQVNRHDRRTNPMHRNGGSRRI